jgi:ribose transport system ATP-binding protein
MIELKKINKSFSTVQVIFDISVSFEEKKVTGIIGENGAGKSTLMNILSGAISDYSGSIILRGEEVSFRNIKEAREKGISIIHQELNILPDLTAGENIFLGREPVRNGLIDYKKLFSDADKILEQFRFPYTANTKMRTLSVGWQQIVEIATALSLNREIIIMDEPTSALSDNETRVLFEKIQFLRKEGKTILFISHRISEVMAISDNIIVMRDGRIAAELKTEATNRDELIGYMAGSSKKGSSRKSAVNRSEEVLKLSNVSVRSSSLSLQDINFTLHKGEVLGVAGLLGSGRTELLKFIYGEHGGKYSGKLYLKQKEFSPRSSSDSIRKKIIYLPEDRKEEGIFPDHSLLFNAGISVLNKFKLNGLLNHEKELNIIEAKFDELKVRRNNPGQMAKTLSGGNQQKVLLSRILLTEPEIILLDDPARGIDINSKEEMYQIIRYVSLKGISVIITSSEIYELLELCSRILVLSNGKQTALVSSSENNVQDILNHAFKQL